MRESRLLPLCTTSGPPRLNASPAVGQVLQRHFPKLEGATATRRFLADFLGVNYPVRVRAVSWLPDRNGALLAVTLYGRILL